MVSLILSDLQKKRAHTKNCEIRLLLLLRLPSLRLLLLLVQLRLRHVVRVSAYLRTYETRALKEAVGDLASRPQVSVSVLLY